MIETEHCFEVSIVNSPPQGWWQRLFCKTAQWPALRGIYFWGGVGRGKTLLMDLFFQALPSDIPGERVHFHSFMNRVHHELKQHRNLADPL